MYKVASLVLGQEHNSPNACEVIKKDIWKKRTVQYRNRARGSTRKMHDIKDVPSFRNDQALLTWYNR